MFFCNFEIKTRVLLTTSVCPVVVMAVIPIRLGFTSTPVDFECDQKLKLVSFKKEVLMTLLQKGSVSSQMLDDFEFFMRVSYDTGSFRGFQGLQQKNGTFVASNLSCNLERITFKVSAACPNSKQETDSVSGKRNKSGP